MSSSIAKDQEAKEKAMKRLYGLLDLQKEVEVRFGQENYNVFVFGSYITTNYRDGQSDIDIAIYSEDFNLYKRLALYLEEYFRARKIESDIFYIDPAMEAPVYCAPLNSKVQFTDYYPDKLVDLKKRCHQRLEEMKARMAG